MPERDERPTPSQRILRSAIGGRPSRMEPETSTPVDEFWAPGRGALECSVVLSALAILVPLLFVGAVSCAWLARRRGHPRWLIATIAAVWCGFLGAFIRYGTGLPIVP